MATRRRACEVDTRPDTSAVRRAERVLCTAVVRAIEAEGDAILADAADTDLKQTAADANGLTEAIAWNLFGHVWAGFHPRAACFERAPHPDPSPAGAGGARVLQAIREWRASVGRAPVADALAHVHQHRLGLEPVVDTASRTLRLRAVRKSRRRAQGAFYTPQPIAAGLVVRTLDPLIERAAQEPDPEEALLSLRVCDPACGHGRFLVEAAGRIAGRLASIRAGTPRERTALVDVVRCCLVGVDLDAFAAELCRASLVELANASDPSEVLRSLRASIRVGDALAGAPHDRATGLDRAGADAWCRSNGWSSKADGLFHWDVEYPQDLCARGGFDAVVGNPPFLSQLRSTTARGRGLSAMLRARLGLGADGYADTSALFLLLAVILTRVGGRTCMIQPQSLLAARDAAPVRQRLLQLAELDSLWIARGEAFEGVGTRVCAPILSITSGQQTQVNRWLSSSFERAEPIDSAALGTSGAPTWSVLLHDPSDPPTLHLRPESTIGDHAAVTADFRDQYYGLAGYLVEDAELSDAQRLDEQAFPKLITSGLIDPALCQWGQKPTRIHKQRWLAPRVDRERLSRETSLGAWVTSRMVPKVLVATQTRVIEVIADPEGHLLPSVPVITVVPHDRSMVWALAAMLGSPVSSALAAQHYTGAALSADAIKLSASQVAGLPCPCWGDHWQQAAVHFERASEHPEKYLTHLRYWASAAVSSWGLTEHDQGLLLDWWNRREPSSRMKPHVSNSRINGGLSARSDAIDTTDPS